MEADDDAASDEALTFIVEGVILTIVSCFGLVGNVMSIFVLTRVPNVRRSFSNLLLGKLLISYFVPNSFGDITDQ